MFNTKGQGTIEYLIIIAIVVVIALVVVGLLTNIMNQGAGVPEATAKAAWKSASPWAIADWDINTATMTIVLKNNSYEALDLIDVNVSSSYNWGTGKSNVAPGGETTIYIANTVTCATAGDRYSFPQSGIKIDYNTPNFSNKTQLGASDIVGTC